jgi:hypothetical protein
VIGVKGLIGRVYWSEQTSMRTRMLLMLDWVKRGIFGRDLSKVSERGVGGALMRRRGERADAVQF